MRIIAVIITGTNRYEKVLHSGYMRSPIWKICAETMKQLSSDAWLAQQGFVQVARKES